VLALSPLDREHLDTEEGRKSAYTTLAEAFNDYEEFEYQNQCIQYRLGQRVNPYAAVAMMETIASNCYELDPSLSTRPNRDAAWVTKVSKEVRTVLSRVWCNYRRSGNQDAENQFTEWVKFCDNISVCYQYAFVIMDGDSLDSMGRRLPEEQERDTGERLLSDTPNARNKRRRRVERRQEGHGGQAQPPLPNDTTAGTFNSTLQSALKIQQTHAILMFVSNCGILPDKDRLDAVNKLRAYVSGGNDAEDSEEEDAMDATTVTWHGGEEFYNENAQDENALDDQQATPSPPTAHTPTAATPSPPTAHNTPTVATPSPSTDTPTAVTTVPNTGVRRHPGPVTTRVGGLTKR
jgi:hypothetical protein